MHISICVHVVSRCFIHNYVLCWLTVLRNYSKRMTFYYNLYIFVCIRFYTYILENILVEKVVFSVKYLVNPAIGNTRN